MVESLDERKLAWMSGRKPVVRGGKLLTQHGVGSGTQFSLVTFLGSESGYLVMSLGRKLVAFAECLSHPAPTFSGATIPW